MAVTVALAQYPITAHRSFDAWQEHTLQWLRTACSQGAELLVFPEYGSMELVAAFPPEIRANLHQQLHTMQEVLQDFRATFRDFARANDCVIVAPSFPVLLANGLFANRAYVFGPNGEGFQDKAFMTRFENEDWGISAGEPVLSVFEAAWGKFGVQICYDIEFPFGAHRLAQAGAQFIVAPSCTETLRGATRVHIGARARAMEQQLYTAVAQTIGEALWSPAVDLNYGYAGVYSSPDKDLPEEGIVAAGVPEKSCWLIATLDFEANAAIRRDGQVFNHADMQRLQLVPEQAVRIENVRLC